MSPSPRPPALNPQATAAELAQLAQQDPALHEQIAGHLGTSMQLLQWIASSSPNEAARHVAAARLSALPPLPNTPTSMPGGAYANTVQGGPAAQYPSPGVPVGKGSAKRKLFGLIAVLAIIAVGSVVAFKVLGIGGRDGAGSRPLPPSPFEMSFDQPPADVSAVLAEAPLKGVDPLGPYVWTEDRGSRHVYKIDDSGTSEVSLPVEQQEKLVINDSIAYILRANSEWSAYDLVSGESTAIAAPHGLKLVDVLAVSRDHLIYVVKNDEGRKGVMAKKHGNMTWRHTDEDFPASFDFTDLQLSADGRWLVTKAHSDTPVAINIENGTILSRDSAEHTVAYFQPLQDGIFAAAGPMWDTTLKVTAFDLEGKRIEGEKYFAYGYPGLNYAPTELQYPLAALLRDEPVDTSTESVDSKFVWVLPNGDRREVTQSAFSGPVVASDNLCRVSALIVNKDTRALCVDTQDNLVAFDIPKDADSQPRSTPPPSLWAVPAAMQPITLHPFNGTSWLLENDKHLYLFK